LDLLAEIDKSEQDWVEKINNIPPEKAERLNDLLDELRG
jgi:hypothetical protein